MEIYIIAIAILCVIAAMIKILMGKPSSNAIKSNLTETQTQ